MMRPIRNALLVILSVMPCCSHSTTNEDPAPLTVAVPSCDAYLVAYRACLSSLDKGQAGDAIERQVEVTRTAFVASASDEEGRARLEQSCAASIERLKTSCL